MEQHEMRGTHRDDNFLDTVAFGSMLVFASVMPPLGPDTIESDSQPMGQSSSPDDLLDHKPGAIPTERAGRRFES